MGPQQSSQYLQRMRHRLQVANLADHILLPYDAQAEAALQKCKQLVIDLLTDEDTLAAHIQHVLIAPDYCCV